MKTKQGNKLIMAFMELKPVYVFGRYSISKDHCACVEDTEEQAIDGFAGIAKYHSDWNWLMPVVGKISGLTDSASMNKWENITCNSEDVTFGLYNDNISYVFEGVCEFLEWNNLHNQQSDQ